MEKMNVLTLIITLVVGVILTGALLGPVIDDATKTEETFTNNGGYYPMNEVLSTDEGTYTIAWNKENTTTLTINGVEYDAYGTYGAAVTTIACGEDWIVRYHSASGAAGYCQTFDGSQWTGDTTTKSLTATASAGTMTVDVVSASDTTTTRTFTYDRMFIIDTTVSDDIMKKSTETPYVKGDSLIYAMGVTPGVSGLIKIEGSITDGVSIDVIGQDSETVSNIVIDATEVNGYEDLYTILKITFDVTIDTTTTNCTYNFFIVPYEVTAELTDHLTPGQISLMGAIPIMVIVALLMAAVGAIALRRND